MAEHGATADAPTGELLSRLSEQTSRLVRGEIQLAQAELSTKVKHVGLGAGMFGAAGLTAFFGVATMVTTAILALALVVPAWLAALIVMVVLFAIAAVLAVIGRKQVKQGVPPKPEQTVESVKQDVQTIKESRTHGDSYEPKHDSTDDPSVAEIRADIDQTRTELGETIEALTAKMDVKTRTKNKAGELKQQAVDTATTDDGQPRPEALIAAATVLVLVVGAVVWWRRR